jgi:hypothetical protein
VLAINNEYKSVYCSEQKIFINKTIVIQLKNDVEKILVNFSTVGFIFIFWVLGLIVISIWELGKNALYILNEKKFFFRIFQNILKFVSQRTPVAQ